MTRKKLFLTAVTLLLAVFGGGGKISAQGIDVTASYIGNFDSCSGENGNPNGHKESDGIGWWNNQTLPDGWHAFVKNGDAIESWSPGIGTAGVMLGRTMVLPSGNYTLNFKAFGTTATNASDKTASSAGDVVAFMTGKDNVDITNTTVGDNTFHAVSFTFDVTTDNTAYEFGIKKLTDESKAEWCQIKDVSLILNSTDRTPVPNNEVSSFTYSGTQTWHTNTWSKEGQWDGSRFQVPFHELWVESGGKLDDATITGSYTPTQTGVYKVSAWVRATNESGGDVTGVKIFVGDAETDACTGSSAINGKGRLGTYTAMADGKSGTPFNYGFKIKDATINWLTFKNVVITYLGELPAADVSALMGQADALLGKEMDATIKSTLSGAKEALNSVKSVANYNALATAISDAQASSEAYALFASERAKAIALGMTEEAIAAVAPSVKDLKVAEYNFVKTNYQYGVSLGEWTKNNAANRSGQHWDGTTGEGASTYSEQDAGWGNTSWTCSYTQDLQLPAGNYVFKVAGRTSAGNSTLSLVVTNKTTSTELGKISDFPKGDQGKGIDTSGATNFGDGTYANSNNGRGWEWRYVKFTLASDATVTVAINGDASEQYQWVGFCNPTVNTDDETNLSLIAYNIALNNATLARDNSDYTNVTGDEKTNLVAAIAADKGSTKASIDAAKETLVEATTAFIAAKNAYDTFVKAKAITCTELPYASATKFAAIATAQAAAVPTSASDATTKANAILSAYRKYVESNALAEGVVGAESITISDPNLNVTYDSENHKFGAWQVIGQTNGNIQLLSSQSFTDGDGNADYKYADIYKNDNNAGIQQTVNLAPGKYILTVTARAQATEGASFILFAGDKTTNIERIGATGGTYDRGWNDATVEFIVNETSDVNIGVQSGNGKDLWWSATRFRLTKIAGVENIDMNITAAEWATFIAPFEVTIPDGVKAYTVEGIEGETLKKTELATTIPANTPVLLNGSAGTYPVSGLNIATEDSYTKGILVGVYNNQVVTSNATYDVYVLQKQDDGLGFYKVSTDAAEAPTVKANRAYIKLASGGGIKALFFDDDEATAIESVDVQTAGEYDAIYTATGVKVNSLQKGLNIVVKNGKSYKIFVK
ncbi:MAG: hypothetical protein IJ550_05755 [Bacteroidaceae bacterium]|nr:hypothetical protein [Bacteroidaceae bacterium]